MTDLIDKNFHLHATKIPRQTERMKVHESQNLAFVDSGLSCDTFNIIHLFNGSRLEKKEIQSAVNYFQSKGFDFCVWISQGNLLPKVQNYLTELSLIQQNAEAGMVLDLKEYLPIQKNEHKNIRVVNDERSINEFANVIAKNWSPPDQNVIRYYNQTSWHYLDKKNSIQLFIYYYQDQPVSVVEMFPTDEETVGLYGFATLEAFRGMGIGSALMTFALNKAKELNFQKVILQASEDGIGIYRKMGFEEITTYFEFA